MNPYQLLRTPLFRLAPEAAHRVAVGGLTAAVSTPVLGPMLRRSLAVEADPLRIRLWGIDFPNPVGLAAGFDKDGRSFAALAALGFGFVEIGTVTPRPQAGNPRPRLFRLTPDAALLNRMGFNNAGAEAVAERLATSRAEVVLGINLGKNKDTPLERASEDYLRSLELLEPFARYLVVNVSSPNTPGLRSLQEAEPLRALLGEVMKARRRETPVLLKLAPDLSDTQIDQAVEIAGSEGIAGIIATNTTTSRVGLRTPGLEALGPGGISGRPLRDRAQAVVHRIYGRTRGKMPIIGVGGIGSASDAWERIRAGASLVQLYSALIYQGPGLVRSINRGLLERLEQGGYGSVIEVVGEAHQ